MGASRVANNMAIDQPSESVEETVHRLKEEIDTLNQQQSEAPKTATYLGMTPDEAQDYDQRAAASRNLSGSSRSLPGRRARLASKLEGSRHTLGPSEPVVTVTEDAKMTLKRRKRLHGTVQKLIKSLPNESEKAEIGIEEAEELYREIRIENELITEDGQKASLKTGAKVDVVVEADSDAIQKKPE
jgi:hypothetical protein